MESLRLPRLLDLVALDGAIGVCVDDLDARAVWLDERARSGAGGLVADPAAHARAVALWLDLPSVEGSDAIRFDWHAVEKSRAPLTWRYLRALDRRGILDAALRATHPVLWETYLRLDDISKGSWRTLAHAVRRAFGSAADLKSSSNPLRAGLGSCLLGDLEAACETRIGEELLDASVCGPGKLEQRALRLRVAMPDYSEAIGQAAVTAAPTSDSETCGGRPATSSPSAPART